jgi:hypothetical protein
MVEIKATLTNEEAYAMRRVMDRQEEWFAKRMSAPSAKKRDDTPLAYNAWRKLTAPIRKHLAVLRG